MSHFTWIDPYINFLQTEAPTDNTSYKTGEKLSDYSIVNRLPNDYL